MNIRATVQLEAVDLETGQSIRIVCPVCGGGNNNEKSLSITRKTTGLLYHCFRGTCGLKPGFIGGMEIRPDTGHNNPTVQDRKRRVQTFEGILTKLPEDIYLEAFAPYQISYDEVLRQGIKYAPEEHKLYFPIYNQEGDQIGETLKNLSKTKSPKYKLYSWGVYPLIHFPTTMDSRLGRVLCLVEDHISAIKVSSLTPCAALLGTYVSNEGLEELYGWDHITIMLDGDAVSKACKLKERLDNIVETNIIILPVGTDPKDLSYDELRKMLNLA